MIPIKTESAWRGTSDCRNRTTADGRLRIVRVLRPGDVAGLEALVTSQYDSEAIALTDISVCRIPLDVVHKLAANSQRLHLKLMQKWQQTLKDAAIEPLDKTGRIYRILQLHKLETT